ncbi:MAG: FtsX-like permease family protein [Cyanobacteria bacterium SBLK]|nr:FtsX-like permease family protein [Cyanobacteria bacterium SBLK]
MFFSKVTPLAWLNLTHSPRRFLTAISGVTFAVFLMFAFKGFENALYDSQVQLIEHLNGEIIITHKLRYFMRSTKKFPRRWLDRIQGVRGVKTTFPLYIRIAEWKNAETNEYGVVRVLAFNLQDPLFLLPEVDRYRKILQLPNTVIVDRFSKSSVGPIDAGVKSELGNRQTQIVGTFSLGSEIVAGDGNFMMSDRNFLSYFSLSNPTLARRILQDVDIGVVKVKPDSDISALVDQLRQILPDDVTILSKEDFIQRELDYWQKTTSVGFVFNMLASMSFVVGISLVYQVLSTDISDHWPEYSTLRAMGYPNRYLLVIVLQEVIILTGLGFVPGLLISMSLYRLLGGLTGLVFQMTLLRAVNMLLITVIMCSISGLISMLKVQEVDPAEGFQ